MAESLGVHRSTIDRWLRVGLPKKPTRGRVEFQSLVESFNPKYLDELSPDFMDLEHLARKFNVENQTEAPGMRDPYKLPSDRSFQKRREGPNTEGTQTQKSWNVKLTERTYLEMAWWYEKKAKSLKKPKDVWLFGFIGASLDPQSGFARYRRSPPRQSGPQAGKPRTGPRIWMHELGHHMDDSFVIMFTVGTNIYDNKADALADISEKLWFELTSLPAREVMIRATFIHNYRYKTRRETIDFNRRDREARRRRKQRRDKEESAEVDL